MFETLAPASDIYQYDFSKCASYKQAQFYLSVIKKKLAANADLPLREELSFFSQKIMNNVPKTLKTLKDLELKDLLVDRAAIATPVRISTRSVKLFQPSEGDPFKEIPYTDFLSQIKNYLETDDSIQLTYEQRQECIEELHSLKLFIQVLFNECLAEANFSKLKPKLEQSLKPEKLTLLIKLETCLTKINFKTGTFSRMDVLQNRRDFNECYKELRKEIEEKKNNQELMAWLIRVRTSFYQRNDFNFTYALAPSSRLSPLKNNIELWGSRLGLAATVGAIIFTAAALSIPFLPFAIPAALVTGLAVASMLCTVIMILTNIPTSLKYIGTAIYNFGCYGVAPTRQEMLSITLTALGLLAAGAGGLFGSMLLGALYADITGGVLFSSYVFRAGMGYKNEQEHQHTEKRKVDISTSSATLSRDISVLDAVVTR